MQKPPIRFEDLHLGSHTQIIDDPVNEVASSVADLHESVEVFLTAEDQVFDGIVFIYAFEESEQFAGLANGFCIEGAGYRRV